MKKYLLLAAIFTASIALAKGAYTPPSQPTFNPTTQSPIFVGQPGYLPQALPGPIGPQRILPETAETYDKAGIWGTTANPTRPAVKTDVAGIPIPIDNKDTVHEKELLYMCAAWAEQSAKDASSLMQVIREADNEHQRCMVARIMHTCVGEAYFNYDEARKEGTAFYREAWVASRDATEKAMARTRKACAGWMSKFTREQLHAMLTLARATAEKMYQ